MVMVMMKITQHFYNIHSLAYNGEECVWLGYITASFQGAQIEGYSLYIPGAAK